MKKEEKLKIIKWFIREKCGLGEIQTEMNKTNDLKTLEQLVMRDRTGFHNSDCETCWYGERDYCTRCSTCNKGSKYVFPYGYWKKFFDRS